MTIKYNKKYNNHLIIKCLNKQVLSKSFIFSMLVFLFSFSFSVSGQDPNLSVLDISDEALARPLIFLLKQKNDSISTLKIKKRRRVYYGYKTKKAYTVTERGRTENLEQFFVLKNDQEKRILYAMHAHWYDRDTREIHTEGYKPGKGCLLHGPYKRKINGKLIEEGIYYKGVKHGRWVLYDKEGHLIRKDKYFRGWPKESLASFYDSQQKKLKALIPVKHGRRDGEYFYFHKNGRVAVTGLYDSGQKIGTWRAFYARTGKKKREIKYQKKPFTHEEQAVIIRDWNKNGKLIFSNL